MQPRDRKRLRLFEMQTQLDQQDQILEIALAALEEITLQTQFILRTLTDTREVVGLLDVGAPRKITVRLLDIYRKRRDIIKKELDDERTNLEEAWRRSVAEKLAAGDDGQLKAACEAAGIPYTAESETSESRPPPPTGSPDVS
jgi:hypothetical protein